MARILIADDRESMRIALKTLFVLRPNWEICGEAEDGREAISKATDLRPDMIVLDFKIASSQWASSGSRDLQEFTHHSDCDVHPV